MTDIGPRPRVCVVYGHPLSPGHPRLPATVVLFISLASSLMDSAMGDRDGSAPSWVRSEPGRQCWITPAIWLQLALGWRLGLISTPPLLAQIIGPCSIPGSKFPSLPVETEN